MTNEQELFNTIAARLAGWGFNVWIAKRGTHGFYCDDTGARVCSFQTISSQVKFSGNYAASRGSGSGWQIEDNAPNDKIQARDWLNRVAPHWANKSPVYTSVVQHLQRYQLSSEFVPFRKAQS